MMTKRSLLKRGYAVKYGSPGWWVDGAFGYLVAGYYPTEDLAVLEAGKAIAQAKAAGRNPAWLL